MTVEVSREEGVVHVELNRPEARNALSLELVQALTQTLDALSVDETVRAVVFSGRGGKAFVSGADIGELLERGQREAFQAINATLFQRIEDFPRPTIAAIEGYALGGGLELALACDLRVVSDSAKLGLPETTLGIFPAAGATSRLPRLVGLGRAKELVFTGRILGAEEAVALGLAETRCAEGKAVETATALARDIARNAPLAVQVAKVALNAVARGAPSLPLEQLGQAILFESADKRARMSEFLEKRKQR